MSCVKTVAQKWEDFKSPQGITVSIVYCTLLVDYMLLSVVDPILPDFFYQQHLIEEGNHKLQHPLAMQSTDLSFSLNFSKIRCSPNEKEKVYLDKESLTIGFLFASKPLVQLVVNFAVGPLTDRIGFTVPMFVGYIIISSSSVVFAFGRSYAVLFAARSIQGIGSSLASTAGLGMVADSYRQYPNERGQAIGVAFGGLAMGVLVGPIFGSLVYQLAGKETVFLILAAMAALLAVAELYFKSLKLKRPEKGEEGTPITTLLCDPYIMLATTALMMGCVCVACLEPGLPIWLIKKMCPEKWQLGVAFLPMSISYLITTNVVAVFCQRIPMWLICMLGLFIGSVGAATFPLARNLWETFPSGILVGVAVGMTDTSMFPLMATLVDSRHKPVYGSVYAIADIGFCVSLILGPLCTGVIVNAIGFTWLMRIIAISYVMFAPLLYFLRNPPAKSEEQIPILSSDAAFIETGITSPNGSATH